MIRLAYNQENTFVAIIDRDGNIRDMSAGRRGDIVGVDYQREDEYKRTISEMQETLDNYYTKLVEIGAITIPKTPEEIAREAAAEQLRIAQDQAQQQSQINQALMNAIENLSSEVKGLKANGSRNRDVDGSCGKQISNYSQSDGSLGKTSKSSASTGPKNAASNP